MRCHEFMVEMNRLLDDRCSTLSDDLLRHTRNCRICRTAWETLRRCDQTLANATSDKDSHVANWLVREPESRLRKHKSRALVLAASCAATIAVMFTLPAVVSQPDGQVTPKSDAVAKSDASQANITPAWSRWTAADLFGIEELWSVRWPSEDLSVAASVSSGIRPVAQTMSSALNVIRQNVLPTARRPNTEDEQASCFRSASLV